MWYGCSENLTESALQHPTTGYSEQKIIQTADPVNVSLRGINVPESHDFMGETNDLMIVVKFQFDNQPPIDRLVYLEHGIEPGWYDDFFDDVILSTNDFAYDELNIHLQVYDVDNISSDLVDSVTQFVDEAASVITYPLLSQFAGYVDFAAEPLVNLVNYINEHDQIIDNKITLEVNEDPNEGHDLFQPGYLVCFERGTGINPDDSEYGLNRDTKVTKPDGSILSESSYAVLEVEREHVQTSDQEINQKVAKLIAELNGKGQSGSEAIDYLRQTLTGYNKYQKLNRVEELMNKDSLSEPEQELLDRLQKEIKGWDANVEQI
ncbi:hypothetical protein [Haloplanus aerogenes]|uniref:Uncharacterized protein n=1 Tax=Haloplanus aerogenes TaxID=660522 RepID=A0A3M0CTG9_9EURY|nr:hypothetical protein [Haloplanus aerogenes]AZH26007.1 hypothetical protein DU502_11825 [Haloplanus aerogenes]RMB11710.1 hypothetical protein ATH50_3415 [Haloplanus aerogenes]